MRNVFLDGRSRSSVTSSGLAVDRTEQRPGWMRVMEGSTLHARHRGVMGPPMRSRIAFHLATLLLDTERG
jgi:hypothetical protein